MSIHQERLQTYEAIKKGFDVETSLRGKRQCQTDGEARWIVAERKWLIDAINKRRSVKGLPSIDVTQFQAKVENRALGHSDYSHKMCLLSTFQALGEA